MNYLQTSDSARHFFADYLLRQHHAFAPPGSALPITQCPHTAAALGKVTAHVGRQVASRDEAIDSQLADVSRFLDATDRVDDAAATAYRGGL